MTYLVVFLLSIAGWAQAQPVVLDDFTTIDPWFVVVADGVSLELSQEDGALRMDVDFRGGGGYAIARRPVDLRLTENYRFTWRLRGDMPVNDFEFKLVDPSGDNVWWHNRRRFSYPTDWQTLVSRARHISFAWGPVGHSAPHHIGYIEMVVTAATGGKGTVWIDDLTLESLPPERPYAGTPVGTADRGTGADALAQGTGTWQKPAGASTLTIDYGEVRTFSALSLAWANGMSASRYALDLSEDGVRWESRYEVDDARGAVHTIPLGETEARWIRLRVEAEQPLGLERLTVHPLSFARTPDDFMFRLAKAAPRGHYPKTYADSVMVYWTVTGLPGHDRELLIDEMGRVELDIGAFSLEPFLRVNGTVLTWADATSHTPFLRDGYIPLPGVTAAFPQASLTTEVVPMPGGVAFVRYRIRNSTPQPLSADLLVGARPLQVNPPWQFLNTPGGVAPIHHVAFSEGGSVRVNDRYTVRPLNAPARFGASTFAAGEALLRMAHNDVALPHEARDAGGRASAGWVFPVSLAPGDSTDVLLLIPLDAAGEAAVATLSDADVAHGEREMVAYWHRRLEQVQFEVPDQELVNAVRANVAYILINADGPRIQPGSRAYERSWIRDGTLTGAALLRLGFEDEVRAFMNWYAPFQYESGRVPCCVDARGADPTAEHDSHGQLIFGFAELARLVNDLSLAERHWPRIAAAVQAMEDLRATRMTDEFRQDTLVAYFGLLPESISHEGYSEKPMHSYWDQTFALRGYRDAAYLARRLGRDDADHYQTLAERFEVDLLASLNLAMQKSEIDYLPGSVELGDFDATSTTTFVAPGGMQHALPQDALRATFDRYWDFFQRRKAGTYTWRNYTPYEWRVPGVMVRLGYPERAHAAFDYFFTDRRPAAWQHWAEVVWKEVPTPRFIGDMPHTWVGSDFLRSALDLFAYEDEERGQLVLGAGLRPEWLPQGVALHGLRTIYGPVGYRITPHATHLEVVFDAHDAQFPIPHGGYRLAFPGQFGRIVADGAILPTTAERELLLQRLPQRLHLYFP